MLQISNTKKQQQLPLIQSNLDKGSITMKEYQKVFRQSRIAEAMTVVLMLGSGAAIAADTSVSTTATSGTAPASTSGTSAPAAVPAKTSNPLNFSGVPINEAKAQAADTTPSNVDYDNDSVQLDAVDVQAVQLGRGQSLSNLDVSTTTITRAQINERPEIYIDQLINKEMGLYTSQVPANQVDPTGATVGIRGIGNSAERVLVMVDGVPINDGAFRTIDWNQIPRDTIEKIEILRGGGATSLWGNLAEGGVINIITRDPGRTPNNVTFRYGSFNTRVGELSSTLYNGDEYQASINFNTIYSDGYTLAPTQGQVGNVVDVRSSAMSNASSATNNGLFSQTWKPTDAAKFYMKLNGSELLQQGITYSTAGNQWYKYDYRGGGEVKYSNTGSFNFNTYYDYSQMDKQNGGQYGSIYSKGCGGTTQGYQSMVTFAQMSDPNCIATINQANSIQKAYNTTHEVMNYQTAGGTAYVSDSLDFGAGGKLDDIKTGVDVRGVSFADQIANYAVNSATPTAASPVAYGSIYQANSAMSAARNTWEGVFTQGTYKAADVPVSVTLGLRADMWQAYNAGTGVSGFSTTGARTSGGFATYKNQNYATFNPRLGFNWDPVDNFTLKGAIYHAYSAPGINQMYRSYYSGTGIQLGNGNLTPETLFGQELTAQWGILDNLRATGTFFNQFLQNTISSTTVCGTTVNTSCQAYLASQNMSAFYNSKLVSATQNLNAGNATIFGGEFSTIYTPVKNIDLNFGIARVNAFLTSLNGQTQQLNANSLKQSGSLLIATHSQMPSVQPLVFTGGGNYNMSEDILQGLSINWLLKAWPTYWSSTLEQQYGVLGTKGTSNYNPGNSSTKISAAAVGDVGMTYQAFPQVKFNLMAQNIGGRYYYAGAVGSTSSTGTIGMPFNVMGGVTITW
jgi:outer membrane receptor protein involved in Fe transport